MYTERKIAGIPFQSHFPEDPYAVPHMPYQALGTIQSLAVPSKPLGTFQTLTAALEEVPCLDPRSTAAKSEHGLLNALLLGGLVCGAFSLQTKIHVKGGYPPFM